MTSKNVSPERAVANIFNSAIAAAGIGAAWELGLLDELRNQKNHLDVNEFATLHNLDAASMQGLAIALAAVDVVERRDQGTIVAGQLFDEAYKRKSLFHWLSLASGELFSRMQYILRNENRSGDNFYRRDPAAIAYACRDINHEHFDPTFWKIMDRLNYTPRSVVDLGSGSGERLMQILDRYPSATGIGIDIAGPATEVAAIEASNRGLGDRLSFMYGDVREMSYRDIYAQVDLLTCFMMGHDFWPRGNCVATLQRLRQAFPKVRRFLLGDNTRILLNGARSEHAVSDDNIPVFTLGFELGQALMGVYVPTMEEWEGVFVEGGWRCVEKHIIESHSLSVIFELEALD